mmetsp:Transcript_10983/g.22091  ORF Transcript_10983/g.22091 Transcript_10983/m.22091 type:complete len:85 (+) Transcript_10983:1217-1471(+)
MAPNLGETSSWDEPSLKMSCPDGILPLEQILFFDYRKKLSLAVSLHKCEFRNTKSCSTVFVILAQQPVPQEILHIIQEVCEAKR